jgi:hypothetical protein
MPTTNQDPANQEPQDGEVIARIHPALYTLVLGGCAVLVAGMGYVASLSFVAYFDLPLNFILFLLTGTICLGAGEERNNAAPGVVLAAVGVLLSCLHLLLVNDHPWLV